MSNGCNVVFRVHFCAKRDKTKVDPLSAAEEPEPAQPLMTVPKGRKPSASTAVIPGTGEIVKDKTGKESRRVVRT